MSRAGIWVAAIGLIASGGMVAQAAAPKPRPDQFSRVIDCRSIDDPAKRLACYDAQVGALDAAEKNKDIVVMNREQIRQTRRSLFGFLLPQFNPGGDKADAADDVREIDATIVSVQRISANGWSFVLSDSAGTWTTTEALFSPPRAGTKVHIKKGLMGGYLGSVGNSDGIRLRRIG